MILQKQNRFLRFLSSWRMQTQILFINALILVFIVPLIIGVQQINSKLLASYIRETQINLLSLQNQKHLENVILEYENQIVQFYKRTESTLQSVDFLYKYVKEHTFTINQQPKMCYLANDDDIYPEDHSYPLLCVSFFNLEYSPTFPTDNKYKNLANLVLLMNEVILENDITQRFLPDNFYLAFDDAESFSAWWPQWARNADYYPQKRPWYIQHKEKYLKDNSLLSQVSDLYEYYTDQPVVAMTATYTITTNGTFEGVMGSDIELLNEYFEEKDLNIMLIAQDGTLILTNYKNTKISNSTSSYKFYDESVTGFNQEDWNQIQYYLQQVEYQSNCIKFKNYMDSQSLCRYNQLYERDVQFSIKNMSFPNYILLVFNDMEASIEQEQRAEAYLKELNGLFFTIFSIFLIVTITLLMFQSICVWFLFRPLYQLIMHSKTYIKANSNKYLFRQKQYYAQSLSMSTNFGANVLQLLKQSYQNIYNRISSQSQRKNIQCQIIQLYQYPRKQVTSRISIDQLPLYSGECKKHKILRIIQDSYLNSVENVI